MLKKYKKNENGNILSKYVRDGVGVRVGDEGIATGTAKLQGKMLITV